MFAGGGLIEFLNSPVGIAVLAVAALPVTVGVGYLLVRIGFRLVSVLVRPTRRVVGLFPEGPAGVVAVTTLLVTALVFGVAAPLPNRVGTLGDGGAGDTAGGFLETAFDERDGVVRAGDGTVSLSPTGYDRPEPDTAGDRLKDAWLRAGETPGGTPLPNGSVDRLDLYVTVVHGSNVEPLTDRDRRHLREIWATMPVRNPDGSTGIDIHIRSGGELDRSVTFGVGDGSDHTRYYTEERMGPRHCRYHLVVLGEPTDDVHGWGTTPGYSSFVTGVPLEEQRGTYTHRASVMTHELLHNVVGHIDDPSLPDGGAHTREGWLADDEYLSAATAAQLNETRFRGSGFYQREICGEDR
ncbi:hypothetical protein [Natronomonas marina]|jgi:hypothetical protein|uniref:hypothetical protein n=1 Tax=Natronomonas marina TaxID=2961939 RepID=UPI0020C9C911|nr:hypothetical protein [Natronomonas marina]